MDWNLLLTSFVGNFCSQLLLTDCIHTFCSNILFTIFVHNYCKSCSQLLLKPLLTTFVHIFLGSMLQRCKKYFSFCHPGIIVQYFLLLSRNFKWGLAYIFQEILFLMFYLKSITPEMWKLSWFSSFLLDYRGRTVCFFYVFEIFSAKPWFWIYFLSSRITGFTTFCTSCASGA